MRQDVQGDDTVVIEYCHVQELALLEASAVLYTELYADDSDLQELSELALMGWPE